MIFNSLAFWSQDTKQGPIIRHFLKLFQLLSEKDSSYLLFSFTKLNVLVYSEISSETLRPYWTESRHTLKKREGLFLNVLSSDPLHLNTLSRRSCNSFRLELYLLTRYYLILDDIEVNGVHSKVSFGPVNLNVCFKQASDIHLVL